MSDQDTNNTVTIVLATTIPSVVLITLAAVFCYRVRRRKSRLFKRGITPIDDEEIESWKVERADEKSIIPEHEQLTGHQRFTTSGRDKTKSQSPSQSPRQSPAQSPTQTEAETPTQSQNRSRHHAQHSSVSSVQKPASVIVYQSHSPGSGRVSAEYSPRYLPQGKRSMDLPQTPVLARAPNARPGLTDEAVQGADAFISQVKRNPSRLAKPQPSSPKHHRSRSSRSVRYSSDRALPDQWYGYNSDQPPSPRQSAETFPRASLSHPSLRSGLYTTAHTPRASYDDEIPLGGLSPRPLIHKSEIGRAIG